MKGRKIVDEMTRRSFLGAVAAGVALLVPGCPGRRFWSNRGSKKGSVRLVFYTDVHARTEWDTPVAMARAAEAINAQKADLVIAGGV